jgi:hypothetical protein
MFADCSFVYDLRPVSIQLVSPTSGETYIHPLGSQTNHVSIQLVSPTSGEVSMIHPSQCEVSRGHLRGSGIFYEIKTCVRSKQSLKPLLSDAARLTTEKGRLS